MDSEKIVHASRGKRTGGTTFWAAFFLVLVTLLIFLLWYGYGARDQITELQTRVEVQDLYLEQIVRIVAVEGCDPIDHSKEWHGWCGDLVVRNEDGDTRITLSQLADNQGYYMNLHWNDYPIINDNKFTRHITGEAHDYSLKHVDE